MSPKQINHAIHKHFGWEYVPAADGWRRNTRELHYEIPNYHGDLNEMHEAEKTLNNGQALKYQDTLISLVCTLDVLFPATRDCAMQGFLHHATSAQRAEAFLRTIGKWNDQ